MSGLGTWLLIACALWMLWGIPAIDARARRKANERAAIRKREWAELDEAIDEHSHWQRFGRGKPYSEPVDLARVMRRMGYDEQTISWLLKPDEDLPRMRDLLLWRRHGRPS